MPSCEEGRQEGERERRNGDRGEYRGEKTDNGEKKGLTWGGAKGVGVLGASSLFPAGGSAGVNAGDEEIGSRGGEGGGRGVCGRPRPGHRHRNTP